MKLLYITNGVTGAGGLERVLSVKASMLADSFGYNVHILSLNEKEMLPFYNFSPNIIFHSIKVKGNPIKYIYEYIKGIKCKVQEINPDIISVCDDGLKGFFIPKILEKKYKIIYERHASVEIAKNKGNSFKIKLEHLLMKNLAKDFDKFVVLTSGNLDEWNSKNIIVIPNPLSFNSATTSNLTNKKVLYVGSLSHNKGTDLLIDIWEKVSKKNPDWEIDIYGKQSARSDFKKMASSRKIKNINFYSPEKEIQKKYLQSSIFVLPSRSEGFGMVLIEAMNCGLPCISFDCPHGPKDILVNDRDGFLIPSENTHIFAEKLILLINDYELRKKMGYEARTSSEKYLPKTVMMDWDKLFNELRA